jgi:preprotein translocase subunit SecG
MLTIAILLQAHGGMGGAFGGDATGQYKTRRGLEKTLFQMTIGISALFFALVVVNVFLLR